MSLRDDLDILGSQETESNEVLQAWLRLDAALTPAALKWLEALPELMELEKQATPGPWVNCGACLMEHDYAKTCKSHFAAFKMQKSGIAKYRVTKIQRNANANMTVALRNALHEAAALSTENDKEMK